VVHLSKDSDVKITKITRHHVRQNLPVTIWRYLIAAGKAFENQVHIGGCISFGNNIHSRRDMAGVSDDLIQILMVLFRKGRKILKLARQRVHVQGSEYAGKLLVDALAGASGNALNSSCGLSGPKILLLSTYVINIGESGTAVVQQTGA
jgi:hypothetical protein